MCIKENLKRWGIRLMCEIKYKKKKKKEEKIIDIRK